VGGGGGDEFGVGKKRKYLELDFVVLPGGRKGVVVESGSLWLFRMVHWEDWDIDTAWVSGYETGQ
jgi:hypothetical protein